MSFINQVLKKIQDISKELIREIKNTFSIYTEGFITLLPDSIHNNSLIKNIIKVVCSIILVIILTLFFSSTRDGQLNNPTHSDDSSNSTSIESSAEPTFEWGDAILGDFLPDPTSYYGEYIYNTNNKLKISIKLVSSQDYLDYVEKCKNNGFSVEQNSTENTFEAYNKEGYKLLLEYLQDSETLKVVLEVPEDMDELQWPVTQLLALLPEPTSEKGCLLSNQKDYSDIYIGLTTLDDFNQYVSLCIEKGFTIDAEKSDFQYKAKNIDDYEITIKYTGYSMKISVSAPVYSVDVELQCYGNWIFNQYDLNIYIDDSFEDTLNHGDTESIALKLLKGEHIIKVVSAENDDIYFPITISTVADTKLKYKIYCYSDEVEVYQIINDEEVKVYKEKINSDEIRIPKSYIFYEGSNYENVISELKELGFTNIKTKKVYDLGTGFFNSMDLNDVSQISIAGNTEFDEDTIFKKNAEIIITYRDYEINDPSIVFTPYSVSTLAKDLYDNPLRAEDKYEGQYVQITGRVELIGSSYVYLKPSSGYYYCSVMCNTQTDEQEEALYNISTGDIITVKGKISAVYSSVSEYSLYIYSM